MNKKVHILLILIITAPSYLFAHSLLLNVFNNDDNTIQVEGTFSTGEPANGAQILLKSLVDKKVLYKKRLPLEGELTITIPKEAYEIILNGGPGHIIVKKGIAPIEGFQKTIDANTKNFLDTKSKNITKQNSRDVIVTYGLSISFFLLFLTMIISILNTNKILKTLKK